MAVVHDLPTNVDRRPEALQGPLHDLDGSLDTRTERARGGQQDFPSRAGARPTAREDPAQAATNRAPSSLPPPAVPPCLRRAPPRRRSIGSPPSGWPSRARRRRRCRCGRSPGSPARRPPQHGHREPGREPPGPDLSQRRSPHGRALPRSSLLPAACGSSCRRRSEARWRRSRRPDGRDASTPSAMPTLATASVGGSVSVVHESPLMPSASASIRAVVRMRSSDVALSLHVGAKADESAVTTDVPT